jgi:hypothetical protein
MVVAQYYIMRREVERMAKRVTRITRSDGTHEESVTQKRGALHHFWVFCAFLFVLAMVIRTWWLGVVIAALVALAIYGGIEERKQGKK